MLRVGIRKNELQQLNARKIDVTCERGISARLFRDRSEPGQFPDHCRNRPLHSQDRSKNRSENRSKNRYPCVRRDRCLRPSAARARDIPATHRSYHRPARFLGMQGDFRLVLYLWQTCAQPAESTGKGFLRPKRHYACPSIAYSHKILLCRDVAVLAGFLQLRHRYRK